MIKIGVSACLMGQNVRYDGNNKFINLKQYFDSEIYQLCAICPEVEMGMGIPRPPIQIINHTNTIKLVQVDNPSIDYSNDMGLWFKQNLKRLAQFQGFILKSQSPSCGNQTTNHYTNEKILKNSDGMFVTLLKQHVKKPNIIDEIKLNNQKHLSNFKKQLTMS